MKRNTWSLLGAALLLAATAGAATPPAAARSAAQRIAAGERSYARNCKVCHAPPFTGYFMLSRRLGAAQAELAERGGVDADLVRVVVRNGLNSMPHIPRGDVSDEDLEDIIQYFNRPRTPAAASAQSP